MKTVACAQIPGAVRFTGFACRGKACWSQAARVGCFGHFHGRTIRTGRNARLLLAPSGAFIKPPALRVVADSDFDILRVLIRLAHRNRCLDTRAYEHATRELDTAGKMLGGWLRSEA